MAYLAINLAHSKTALRRRGYMGAKVGEVVKELGGGWVTNMFGRGIFR